MPIWEIWTTSSLLVNYLVSTRSCHLFYLYLLNMHLVSPYLSVCCNILYALIVTELPKRIFPPSVSKGVYLAIFMLCLRKLNMTDTLCLLEMNLDYVCKNAPQEHTGLTVGVMVAILEWGLSWKKLIYFNRNYVFSDQIFWRSYQELSFFVLIKTMFVHRFSLHGHMFWCISLMKWRIEAWYLITIYFTYSCYVLNLHHIR